MAARWQKLYRGTPAELSIEDAVARLGIPYRNQYPGYSVGVRHFPDFYLPTINVILEVDDPSHNRAEKMKADAERTATFAREWGAKVCRTTNEAAITAPDEAVRTALASIGMWPLPSRLPRIADCLPKPRNCPQKIKRAIVSEANRQRRARRSPAPAGTPKPPKPE